MKWYEDLKKKWFLEQETKFRKEFESKLSEMEGSYRQEFEKRRDDFDNSVLDLKKKQEELDILKAKGDRLEVELERANEDLSEQLKLIEAKARPDAVWVEAFSLGISKAWDFLFPIFSENISKMKEKIRDEAIDETIQNLTTVINLRLEECEKANLRPVNELLSKREDFLRRKDSSVTDQEKLKYSYFIQAIDWALDGNNLLQNKPVSGTG